jgi:hypothetical protein
MPRTKGNSKIGAAAFFISRIAGRIGTFVEMRADIGNQVPAC